MNIPVNVDVYCSDGLCGRSSHLIVNLASKQVTHLVVKKTQAPYMEYLAPLDQMVDSTPDMIKLRCTTAGLATLPPFINVDTIQNDTQSMGYPAAAFGDGDGLPMGVGAWPYDPGERFTVTVKTEAVPEGEVALTRGAHIHARDGQIGRLDGFLADSTTGAITHLILREGHLWGQKDVTIPVAQIDHLADDSIYLKLDKASIGALPITLVRP